MSIRRRASASAEQPRRSGVFLRSLWSKITERGAVLRATSSDVLRKINSPRGRRRLPSFVVEVFPRICTLSPEAQTLLSQWLHQRDPSLDSAVHSILSKVDRWFTTKYRDQCMVFDCGCGIQQVTASSKAVFQSRVLTFPSTPACNKAPLQKTLRAACNSIHGWLRVHPANQALVLADSCSCVCAFMASYAYFTDLCEHPVQGLKFLDGHIKQIADRSKTRNPANKHRAGAWVPPSLVRCLASFARINTCAHGHAIKRTPQQLHLTHVAIVNTPDMRDSAFRPYVCIMAGSCDDLQMKFSSMAGGTCLYRPGSTAIYKPRIEVRGEIALKVFNMKTSGVPKSQFVLNMHGDTLQLDTPSPPLSESTAVAPTSASNRPAKVMTIVRCLKRHIDGVEFDERFDDGFAVEFAFTHVTDVKDSGDNAEESERDIRDGGLRALYPESITRIKCDRITCGHIFVYPPVTPATSASASQGRVQCPKCQTVMCVPFLLSGSQQRSRPIPARREVVLEESQTLARSAPQPRRAISHDSRMRSMSLTDNMGRPRVPPPPAVETFTPDNESDIRVGARVRALWLGQDRHRWPDWYLATVTAAHADGSFSLMYDDGYRGFGVPRTAIRCSVEHHIELLREMFPAVPFSVLKQRVTEANAQGLTQEQLVDVVMRINEAYNSQSRAHGVDATTAAAASASSSADASYRPASQADLRAGNALMTPVGVGTMLQFRPRDGIVIVKLPWSVVCVHIDQVRVQERPENARSTTTSNSATPDAASSQRAQQILFDEILARELSIDSHGNIPQSPEIFTDHVVGPEDSRIGAAEITEIVNLPTFKFSIQTSSCVQTSNMMCTVCQCDFEEGELLRTLPCNHVYHVECIDPWLRMKKVCPICNTPIDKPPISPTAER